MSEAMVKREEFSSEESTAIVETSSTAVAAQAKAKTEAHFIMAMKRPRDLMVARGKLLDACKRPGFARSALYRKPIGREHIEGPSVRFAEEVIRCLGNIQPETAVIYDDKEKRIVRVSVTDLESNVPYSTDVVIEKKVERSRVQEGQKVFGQRKNSRGYTTYIVEATEDDLQVKQAAIVSKALRTNALRLLPGDLLEEAIAQIKATLQNEHAQDPAAAKKAAADYFARLGISAAQIKKYLGHDLSEATPDEMVELRGIAEAIKDKETTWDEVMESRRGASDDGEPDDLRVKVMNKAKAKTVEVEAETSEESA